MSQALTPPSGDPRRGMAAIKKAARPDVQAAVTVIGRRNHRHDIPDRHINLRGADLTHADLTDAYLSGARLSGADLSGARLEGADLSGARLVSVDLSGAYLTGANLSHANLFAADLTHADLDLARLTGADLTGVSVQQDAVIPEGWQRDTDSGRLKRADPSSGGKATN